MSHLNINGVDKPLDHVYVKARTANLAPPMDIWLNDYVNTSGQISAQSATRLEKTSPLIQVDDSLAYAYSYGSNSGYFPEGDENVGWRAIACYDTNEVFLSRIGGNGRHPIITTGENALPTGTAFIRLTLRTYGNNTDCMLNTGSTALPYQPYLTTKEAWEAKSRVILHGLTNPLCGISTYKDTLDLSTGPLTRYVKKRVLTGTEEGDWTYNTAIHNGNGFFNSSIFADYMQNSGSGYCTHYSLATTAGAGRGVYFGRYVNFITAFAEGIDTTDKWKSYLATQYAAGTPVTVWYVLATPETEQIAIPSGLTGTIEGYLTQTGTPTPTNPICPTANGTLEQGGTYSLDTGAYAIAWGRADTFTGTNSISARCYGLPVKSWEIDGNSQQSGTPTQDDPIIPEFVGERTTNLFDIVAFAENAYENHATIARNGNMIILTATAADAYVNQVILDGNTTPAQYRPSCISVEPETEYTIYLSKAPKCYISWINDSFLAVADFTRIPSSYDPTSYTFTTPAGCTKILLRIGQETTIGTTIQFSDIMLVKGSTAPSSYIPYGYSVQTYSSIQNTVSGQTPLTLTDSVGHNLISWDGEGATTSSGTPAPTSPVTVSGWGDKTANLLPQKRTTTLKGITFATQPDGTTLCNGTADGEITFGWTVPANISGDYYFSGCPAGGSMQTYDVFCWDKTAAARPKQWDGTSASLSDFGTTKNNEVKIVSGHDTEVRIRFRDGYKAENLVFSMMLREPSSPSNFEPSGYKLNMTSAGQTTPVYLGQVPTTRRVWKLVLTGGEDWFVASSNSHGITNFQYPSTISDRLAEVGNILSTHYVSSTSGNADVTEPSIRIINSGTMYIRMYTSSYSTADAFKTYLQQQYQNGTPVVVWYVLAEPTTGIVNEPLMKIGGYADSITSTQAGVTIPTTKGNATLTTSNTVQPSTMHATYDKYISGGDIPVYLGQVPTTRKVRKLVLTGEEVEWHDSPSWDYTGTKVYYMLRTGAYMPNANYTLCVCSHYQAVSRNTLRENDYEACAMTGGGDAVYTAFRVDSALNDIAAWKTYLATQYAAGTPVTIWYVLKTTETGIVNEPLCKIGDYADTLTSAQAGATIPTIDGNNTISVDTSLSPSRFEVKVHAKPI